MEAVKQIMEDNDSDNEEIFFGPVTKREVMLKLKHNNLCSDELLEPLQKYQDDDVLDDSVIKFYYEDAFPKGSNSEEEDSSWTSRFTESSANVSNDQNTEDSFSNTESSAHTDHLDRISLTESNLLKKYVASESCQLSNTTKNKSVTELEEPLYELEQLSISIKSTPEKSAFDSLNSTPDKCETLSLDSTSLNCTPQADSNNHSGFNCTLDEMEMFMKFGENYMNESKDKDRSHTESEKDNDPQTPSKESRDRSYTESEKEYDPQTPSKESKDRLHTESEKENDPQTASKESNKLIRTPKQHCYNYESPFKLPTRTIFKKSPAPVSAYRNIVSPVAMYIKSSPKVPLVQNVSKKTVHASTFSIVDVDVDANVKPRATAGLPLPTRSYRPATRAVLLSREPEPTLPGSLRRLVRGPLLPEVIRHVGRVATVPDTCELVTPAAPPVEDLTMLSSSLVQGDVSVYVSTNAARTNRLQHT